MEKYKIIERIKGPESEVIIREREDGMHEMEIKLSEKLEKEMAELAEKTAGTIQAL